MEWVPAPKAEVLKLAVPPVRGRLPEMATGPSKKVTVPVADDGTTLAVNVNETPYTEGLVPEARTMVTEALALGVLMVSVSAGEVALLNVSSPLYCAVIECVPADKVAIVKLAEPDTMGTLPEIAVAPSKNTTLPVAEPGVTFAANVKESPMSAGFVPAVKVTLTLLLPLTTF